MSNPQLIVFVNFLARTREVRNSRVIYLFHILSEKFFKEYETSLGKMDNTFVIRYCDNDNLKAFGWTN